MKTDFTSTLAILTAVKTALAAAKLTTAGDAPALFDLVRLYDATDIDRAFADLLVTDERRVCFVLPGGDAYENRLSEVYLSTEKTTKFALLICDTDRQTGVQAVFGGDDAVGTITAKDRVVEVLTGASLGLPYVVLQPEEGDDLEVVKEGQSDSGRKGWFQLFKTPAGVKRVSRL